MSELKNIDKAYIANTYARFPLEIISGKGSLVYDENGNCEMKMTVDLGLTIDERIADGYYYSKSVKLFKKLMANPELLDMRADEEVEI